MVCLVFSRRTTRVLLLIYNNIIYKVDIHSVYSAISTAGIHWGVSGKNSTFKQLGSFLHCCSIRYSAFKRLIASRCCSTNSTSKWSICSRRITSMAFANCPGFLVELFSLAAISLEMCIGDACIDLHFQSRYRSPKNAL